MKASKHACNGKIRVETWHLKNMKNKNSSDDT
jgi:hypothetical protein